VRVLLIDDHELFRAGMVLVLRQFHPEAQVFQAPTAVSAMVNVSPSAGINLVLMDWNLPQEDPLVNLQRVKAQWPGARVVIVSANEPPTQFERLQALGAAGYIAKDSSPDQFMQGIAVVLEGGIYAPKPVGGLATQATPHSDHNWAALDTKPTTASQTAVERLTPRQKQVLQGLQKGLANKQIARDLDIAEETVKQHLSAIYEALGVRGRTEALSTLATGPSPQ